MTHADPGWNKAKNELVKKAQLVRGQGIMGVGGR